MCTYNILAGGTTHIFQQIYIYRVFIISVIQWTGVVISHYTRSHILRVPLLKNKVFELRFQLQHFKFFLLRYLWAQKYSDFLHLQYRPLQIAKNQIYHVKISQFIVCTGRQTDEQTDRPLKVNSPCHPNFLIYLILYTIFRLILGQVNKTIITIITVQHGTRVLKYGEQVMINEYFDTNSSYKSIFFCGTKLQQRSFVRSFVQQKIANYLKGEIL